MSQEKGRYFNEDNCHFYFKLFTKINTFRNGAKNNRFEKCGHLYVTETAFAKYLAHNNLVKFEDDDIPFAKNIDFVTTRFWFTLKKGFSNKQSLPKSFDVITKAKIILSSHLTNGISKNYESLLADKKSGKLTDEEAIARSYSLREKPTAPEEINLENLDEALDFLQNENYLEDFYREKVRKDQLLETTEREKNELQLALQSYKDKENEEKERLNKIAFDERKNNFVEEVWENHIKENNKDLLLFLFVAFANLYLITTALSISLSKDLKEWFLKFEIYQILIILSYIIVLLIDILGSKYLFDKGQIVNGWKWFKTLFNYSEYKETKIDTIEKEYTE